MIKRLFALLGYFPADVLDQAYYEGRCHGQEETVEECRILVDNLRARYSGIEQHRDDLIKVLTRQAIYRIPRTIIIKEPESG